MDIRPPKRPQAYVSPARPAQEVSHEAVGVKKRDVSPHSEALKMEPSPTLYKRPKKRKLLFVLVSAIVFLVLAVLGVSFWYQVQLRPVDEFSTETVQFAVGEGESFDAITSRLKVQGLIRDKYAFSLLAWLEYEHDSVKSQSTCRLSPSESAQTILDKLVEGCHDFKVITFYPGATIEKPLYKQTDSSSGGKMYIKYVLQQAGFSDKEISSALAKQYNSPIFADKPDGTTLEGYVFGETYYVATNATAEEVLQDTFDQFNKIIDQGNLASLFEKQGLNLYQGITLASIVQRELNCEDKPTQERKDRCYGYQQTIAQVFLKRLREGMTLGSDVTFIYAADMRGVTPSPLLDSPYNTRLYTGLPPGPIAAPGELALKAVANPSSTEYLYFLAGDDGLIYFAKTLDEHNANIVAHCQTSCEL